MTETIILVAGRPGKLCVQGAVVLCGAGVPEGAPYVHVMYVFRDPASDAPYDESIGVNFKLPVRDED